MPYGHFTKANSIVSHWFKQKKKCSINLCLSFQREPATTKSLKSLLHVFRKGGGTKTGPKCSQLNRNIEKASKAMDNETINSCLALFLVPQGIQKRYTCYGEHIQVYSQCNNVHPKAETLNW